ncbi:MAG: hypothetical protein FWG00_03915 [Coriobacteriia bacterium]|jgi:hypothetical protein|nr:hypothetical protein [Coriobacteriia bacterium]MDR2714590.1 hypothetical protein [Coriobacteriales bacterium]
MSKTKFFVGLFVAGIILFVLDMYVIGKLVEPLGAVVVLAVSLGMILVGLIGGCISSKKARAFFRLFLGFFPF